MTFEEPTIAATLAPCQGLIHVRWETIGEIEALKERGERSRPCSGFGWFELVIAAGEAPIRVCSLHVARAALRLNALSVRTVLLRCPRCSSVGTHADAARELCNRCGAVVAAHYQVHP